MLSSSEKMNGYDQSTDEHQPLIWVRGHAIYAAHCIVIVFVLSMLIASILMAVGQGHLLAWASFDSAAVLQGQAWRLLTYGLVNPPQPGWGTLSFALDMFMIVWFGRELEKFFGRRLFLRFYGGLYLLTPILFTLIGLRWPMHLAGESGAFALFIGFATLYPNVMMMMLNVPIKWVAAIMVSLYSVASLAYHDWVGLIALWATTTYAFSFVSFEQGRFTLPSFRFGQRQPKLRLLPDLKPAKTINVKVGKENSMVEMDALLDKIARSGLSSLTAKERAQLAKAREEMMQKKTDRS